MKEVFWDVETRMKRAMEHLQQEFKHLRTGRASLSLLDSVLVDYYGTPAPLNQMATLSVADSNLIVAQPYEPSQIAAIELGIRKADLGLNQNSDGRVIRIPVPALTEERRREIKKAHDLAEPARNPIRQARQEGAAILKKMEQNHEVTEDDERRGLDELQKLHDRYLGEINFALQKKEHEVLG